MLWLSAQSSLLCGAYYEMVQKAVIHIKTTTEENRTKLIKMWNCISCKVESGMHLKLIGLPTQWCFQGQKIEVL